MTAETHRTNIPGEGGIARQCSPVGDSKGDEKRRNDLFNATVRKLISTASLANLDLSRDLQEYKLVETPGGPRYHVRYETKNQKGRRLDEDGDDGLVQSASTCRRTHGVSDIPSVQNQSYNNHEREEDVKRRSHRNVWCAEVDQGVEGENNRFPL